MADMQYDQILLNFSSRVDAKGLQSAVNALSKLKDINGFSGLKQAGQDLKGFCDALDGISHKRMTAITDLAKAMKGLGGASKAMKAVASTAQTSNPLNDTSMGVGMPPALEGTNQQAQELKSAMQGVKEEAEKASEATKSIGKSAEEAVTPIQTIWAKLKKIAEYRLIRSIISGIVSGLKEGVKNLENWDRSTGHTGFADSMDRARESLLVLKNSLAVASAPFLQFLISCLQVIARLAMIVANHISALFAMLGGSASYRAVKWADYTAGAMDKTAGSAKKATEEFKKQLMGFDEINNITNTDTGGGGGGVGAGGGFNLDDMFETKKLQGWALKVAEYMAKVKEAWKQGVEDLKTRLSNAWDHIKGWGATLKQFFSDLWNGIKIIASSVWEKMKADAQSLGNFFKVVWNGIKSVAQFTWDAIKTTVSGVIKGVQLEIQKLQSAFHTISEVAKSAFQIVSASIEYVGTLAGNMWKVLTGKQTLAEFKANMEEAKNTLEGKVKTATDNLKTALENTFNRKWYLKTQWDEIINRTVHVNEVYTAIGSKGMRTVEMYAGGGEVPQGQLFIAREAGAELVGQVGGHTAVMNNQDIVGAVSQGVASAVASVMGNGTNVSVTLEGDAKGLFKVVQREGRAYSARTGQPALA